MLACSLALIELLLMSLSGFACTLKTKRSQEAQAPGSRHRLELAPALMLTTSDKISFVYPKEMGYEKDFMHTIYRVNNQKQQLQVDLSSTNQKENQNSFSNESKWLVAEEPSMTSPIYKIDDAVYDNQTWSIYLIVSSSSSGSELIRLKRNQPSQLARYWSTQSPRNKSAEASAGYLHAINISGEQQQQHYSYELASNWSHRLIYKNSSIKILSLDINVKKRKLYWFEFNMESKRWSFVVYKLQKPKPKPKLHVAGLTDMQQAIYFTFGYSRKPYFSRDGYSFIAVARDSLIYADTGDEYKPKVAKHDIILFVSNNQTLNICFMINMTCRDYFRSPKIVERSSTKQITSTSQSVTKVINEGAGSYADFMEEEYDEENGSDQFQNQANLVDISSKSVSEIKTVTQTVYSSASAFSAEATSHESSNMINDDYYWTPEDSLYKFGRLMGIYYDAKEHALYLNDYGYDRLEKLTFINESYANEYKFGKIESVLKSDYGQEPINPIMSVFYDNHIFWVDYENGLKTSVFKSSCTRSIYKTNDAGTLRFVHIGALVKQQELQQQQHNPEFKSPLEDSSSMQVLNRLVSLEQNNRFKYPPDYYFYFPNGDYSMSRMEQDYLKDKNLKLMASDTSSSSFWHSCMLIKLSLPISYFTLIYLNGIFL
jgi:hypothetical protein